MALPEQYLVTTKNLDSFFAAVKNAQAPPKFTIKFLEGLGFKSTNDRLFVGVLKALDFIDSNGTPLEKYYKFIDETQSEQVLADSIREAYKDLFQLNTKAYNMSANDVKNKFKTIAMGAKSDRVLGWMANTFVALCKFADFSQENAQAVEVVDKSNNDTPYPPYITPPNVQAEFVNKTIATEMHYNIQIHLPETRDMNVYDAIFKSLKEHLL